MKITLNGIITSITSKVDGSLGLRLNTPELSTKEKAVIMDIQNKNLNVLIEPLEEKSEDILDIKGEIGEKTPSQRLRAVLYLYWQQNKKAKWQDFNAYYRHEMEKQIETVKSLLN